MKQISEDSRKVRSVEQRASKEIAQLRKEQRRKDNQIRSLAAETKKKDVVIRRKQEEVGGATGRFFGRDFVEIFRGKNVIFFRVFIAGLIAVSWGGGFAVFFPVDVWCFAT